MRELYLVIFFIFITKVSNAQQITFGFLVKLFEAKADTRTDLLINRGWSVVGTKSFKETLDELEAQGKQIEDDTPLSWVIYGFKIHPEGDGAQSILEYCSYLKNPEAIITLTTLKLKTYQILKQNVTKAGLKKGNTEYVDNGVKTSYIGKKYIVSFWTGTDKALASSVYKVSIQTKA